MITVFYKSATGKILRVASALNAAEAVSLTEDDESIAFTSDAIVPCEHFVDLSTGEIVAYSETQIAAAQSRAKPGFVWDVPNGIWVDERTLPQTKADRISQLKANRDIAVNSTFTWNSSVFDSDTVSQMRILGLYTSALNTPAIFPIDWRLNDNSWRSLSAIDAADVWVALQTHVQTCFGLYAAHEVGINACETTTAVLAYDIDSIWP